jgi:serine/threonine protein phosphatase 1
VGLLKNRITDEPDWGDDWEDNWEEYDVINIFGHTDYDEVNIEKKYYGINTGCVYNRKLSAIALESMEIFEAMTDMRDILKMGFI